MKEELEFMCSNKVQGLIETPEGIKHIGYKWVYKSKRGVGGKVKTCKTKLLVKGYNKKPSFIYEETFLLVDVHQFIKVLLSIVAHLNYEKQQIDLKKIFLNGFLNKSIYMMQPNGFITKG